MRKLLLLVATWLFVWTSLAQAQVVTSKITIVPATLIYTTGACVGGVQTIPDMFRSGGSTGTILVGISVVDNTGTNSSIDYLVFNAAPTGTYVDNVACTVASADVARLAGVVPNTLFTCVKDQPTTTGICQATPALPVTTTATGSGNTNLWVVPIMRGTPTYGASKLLSLYFNAIHN